MNVWLLTQRAPPLPPPWIPAQILTSGITPAQWRVCLGTTPPPPPGFSVFQPALGAALQFLPALGTPELDSLIDAFLPGPASLKDKRATLCMDFCEYARQTGETIKFYPVSSAPTSSPASSAAMYDSGYASSFNVSPAVSDMNLWGQSSAFTAPPPRPLTHPPASPGHSPGPLPSASLAPPRLGHQRATSLTCLA